MEWDAVELPSQFMENWCYDKPTLYGTSNLLEPLVVTVHAPGPVEQLPLTSHPLPLTSIPSLLLTSLPLTSLSPYLYSPPSLSLPLTSLSPPSLSSLLLGFAKHYQTGEPLPEELFIKMKEAKNYQVSTLLSDTACGSYSVCHWMNFSG